MDPPTSQRKKQSLGSLTRKSVVRFSCVYSGLFYVPFFGPGAILFLFRHRATAMATAAASVSLTMFSRPDPRAK